jgi:ABC-type Na+ efflux pump permease subunit
MFNGTFALLERSLRIDVRSRTTHLVRLALMGTIYFAMCSAITTGVVLGAPGLFFFTWIAVLDVAFITLLGIGFFSSTITEEKEEDTLGLMLMAGISPLGILLGKSVGPLWQALVLVAIQYPFMLLAVTMGGVSQLQVLAVVVALLSYILFLAGFGLFCSTIAPFNRKAATYVTLGIVLYFAIPGISKWMVWEHTRWLVKYGQAHESSIVWRNLESIGTTCIFLQLKEILSTGFNRSAFSLQVVSNVVAGIFWLAMSWLFFGLATRDPSAHTTSRGLVAVHRESFHYPAGRAWTNPFVWKDFYFVSGGIWMIGLRSIYYFSLILGVYLYYVIFLPRPGIEIWIEPCLIFTSFSVSVDAGLLLSRSLQDEIRGQMISSLLMLPRSSVALIYSKLAGALLGWLPGPLIELVLTCTNERGHRDLWWLFSGVNYGAGYCIAMWFIMLPHVAALTSTYVRWGAVPIAIGLCFGGVFAGEMVQSVFLQYLGPQVLIPMNAIVMVSICVACHIIVLIRTQALAAR